MTAAFPVSPPSASLPPHLPPSPRCSRIPRSGAATIARRSPRRCRPAFAALDAALPGRGWPQGALTEMLLEREGIGEIRLTLPALARVQAQGRDVVWIAPPHRPYAPALAAAGLDLARLHRRALPRPEGRAVGLRAGAARARMRRRVRVARDARRARAAPAAGRGARRPHVGRAVAAARPARQRDRRAAAPRACRRSGRQLAVRVLKRRGARVAAAGPDRRRQAGSRALRTPPPPRCRRASRNDPSRLTSGTQ